MTTTPIVTSFKVEGKTADEIYALAERGAREFAGTREFQVEDITAQRTHRTAEGTSVLWSADVTVRVMGG